MGVIAAHAEDLPDLEAVVAGPAVEGGDRGVVVDGEVVVAAVAEHREAAVDGVVVVDPLDHAGVGAQVARRSAGRALPGLPGCSTET